MQFSTSVGLILIALLLALWALTLARRALGASDRAVIAAEKSALAAERSAMAAKRAADAAETSATTAQDAAGGSAPPPLDDTARARAARIEPVVQELIDAWQRDASAWPLVERNPGLNDAEVDEIIHQAFHSMGRTEAEAKQHTVAVLNMRRDRAV